MTDTLRGISNLKKIDKLGRREAYGIAVQVLAQDVTRFAFSPAKCAGPLMLIDYLTGIERCDSAYTCSECREILASAAHDLTAQAADAIDTYLIVAVLGGAR